MEEGQGSYLSQLLESSDPMAAAAPFAGALNWSSRMEFESKAYLEAVGLSVEVIYARVEDLVSNQGELSSDRTRDENLIKAMLAGEPIPPLIVTRLPDGRILILDGHHRRNGIIRAFWVPYPPARCLLVTYPTGAPFRWTDNELTQRLKKDFPQDRAPSDPLVSSPPRVQPATYLTSLLST